MARQFGIITTTSGITSIVVTSLTQSQSVEIAEARNSQGQVTDLKAYSKAQKVNIKGLLDATALAVHAGDSLTLGSITYLIETCETVETNKGYAEVTISARTSDSASISAIQ